MSGTVVPLTASDIGFGALSRPFTDAVAALQGTSVQNSSGPTSIYSAVASFQQHLSRDDTTRLPFGLGRVDRATRGIEPGELAILLGRTASLKTMWALNLVRLLVKARPRAAGLVVEMEMPREQLVRRLLRMDYNRSDELLDAAIKARTIDLERFCETYQNLYFVDQGCVSLAVIERYACDLRRQLGDVPLDWLLLDHAGLLKPESTSGGAYERASAAAIGLKQLARSLAIPVFCIVQANRAGNQTNGEPVNLEAA